MIKLVLGGLVLSFLGTMACEKDASIPNDFDCGKSAQNVEMFYLQTYCADAWGYSSMEEAVLKEAVEAHFLGKGIRLCVSEIVMDQKARMTCQACNCESGNVIYVKVPKEKQAQMLDNGFRL